MYTAIVISVTTCLIMILGVLFFPKISVGRLKIDSYWVVTLAGAMLLLLTSEADADKIGAALIADTPINPLKILALFISMTVISIYLDELGFFKYLAQKALKRVHLGQRTLFLCLYLTVSALTVFTSNDIIILSFTPFICYFAKNAKIDPLPYLAAEFVAANTCSMALIIGNPTNIYLATAFGIDFLSYLKVSLIPTIFAVAAAFLVLYAIFRKKLREPIRGYAEPVVIKDKVQLAVGIAHLVVCTVMLAVSQYIGVEMWLVAVAAMVSLLIFALIFAAVRKNKPTELANCVERVPFQLIPFVLSMFIIILTLNQHGVTAKLAQIIGDKQPILCYGLSSFAAANLINNIPMSVLYSSIIGCIKDGGIAVQAVYATIVGSNIGAFLTPIGALAGIMWSSILNDHGIKFSYTDFLKIGVAVAIPTIFAALAGLYIAL